MNTGLVRCSDGSKFEWYVGSQVIYFVNSLHKGPEFEWVLKIQTKNAKICSI